MNISQNKQQPTTSLFPGSVSKLHLLAIVLVCGLLNGCAAVTNPLVAGLPVRLVPPELLAERRDGEQPIPFYLLQRDPPRVYRLAAGDVLGVWIKTVIGNENLPPLPVSSPPRFLPFERAELPPALGYPFAVRDDGTISLPEVKPIPVDGLTVQQVEEAIRKAYTVTNKIIKPGEERIYVSLMRPRLSQVVVFRHDFPPGIPNANFQVSTVGSAFGGSQLMGTSTTGSGHIVDLPGNENDVLHALATTGGFPGSTAADHIIVYRGFFTGEQPPGAIKQLADMNANYKHATSAGCLDGRITRIPIRLRAGEIPAITAQDITLETGDAVFVEAREVRTFYTGGLLPPGEYTLPNDYDLDVLQAIARVRGPILNGAFGGSNLSGNLIVPGIGDPNPSLLVVVRRTPNGCQIPIRVDLNRAFLDPRERIVLCSGDILILQETPGEALSRYFTQVFQLNLLYKSFPPNRATATSSTTLFSP